MNKRQILLVALALMLNMAVAIAYDSGTPYTVTMNFIVPSDTTFTVALAGVEVTIDFNPADKDSAQVEPDSQTNVTAMVTVTNQGNVGMDYNCDLTVTKPTWVTLKGNNAYNYGTATIFDNGNAYTFALNVTSFGGTADLWLWADFVNASGGTTQRQFRVNGVEA